MSAGRLKLVALDQEDLKILAAHLQDALVRAGDLAFLKRARRFAAVVSRFCWEEAPVHRRIAPKRRARTGLRIEGVTAVQARGLSRAYPDAVLSLLDIAFAPDTEEGAAGGMLTLVFSGNADIRIDVECLEIYLEDTGVVWDTRNRPLHDGI